MKINVQINLFPDAELRHIITDAQETKEVSEKVFVPNLLKNAKQNNTHASIEKFVSSIEQHVEQKSKQKQEHKAAKRLIKILFKAEKTEINLTQGLLTKIDSVYRKFHPEAENKKSPVLLEKQPQQAVEAAEIRSSQLQGEDIKISEFGQLSKNLGKVQEILKNLGIRCDQDAAIQQRKRLLNDDKDHPEVFKRMEAHLPDNQRLILVRTPKRTNEDAKKYWEMVLAKEVPVMMTACSPYQWKEIIPFWQQDIVLEVAKDIQTSTGATITFLSTKAIHTSEEKVMDNNKQQEVTPAIIETKFTITDANQKQREATHLHYHGWPDHSIAPNTDLLKKMIARAEELAKDKNQPIAANCQGGYGRTGVIAAYICFKNQIDNQVKQGKPLEEISLNISDTLLELRKTRPALLSRDIQLAQVCGLIGDYYDTLVQAKVKSESSDTLDAEAIKATMETARVTDNLNTLALQDIT